MGDFRFKVSVLSTGYKYCLDRDQRPNQENMTTVLWRLHRRHRTGPLLVLSAIDLSDPAHDPDLLDHIGRHPQICASMMTVCLDIGQPRTFARQIRKLVGEALKARADNLTIIFWCRSGRHRCVSLAEIWAFILNHMPMFEVTVGHVQEQDWGGCRGQCGPCRASCVQQVFNRPLYQRMLDAFAAEWEVLSPGTISRQIGQYLVPDADNTIPRPGQQRAIADAPPAASPFGRAKGASQRAATHPPAAKGKAAPGAPTAAKAKAPATTSASMDLTTDGADPSASGSAARSRGPGPQRDAKAAQPGNVPAMLSLRVLPHLQHDPNQTMPVDGQTPPKQTTLVGPPPKQQSGSRPRAASLPPPNSSGTPKDGPPMKPAPMPAPEASLDARIFERIIEDVGLLSAQQFRLLRRHLARHAHAGRDRQEASVQAAAATVEQETQVEDTPPMQDGSAAQTVTEAPAQASVGTETRHLPQHPLHPQELERMRASVWPWMEDGQIEHRLRVESDRPEKDPAWWDLRRSWTMAQLTDAVGARKKSWNWWGMPGARVTMRFLPSCTKVSAPDDMGGVALVRTTFGWPKYGSRWHVLDEREPNDNWAPVDQQYLLLVMVLQPANSGDFVPRDYKSSASKQCQHWMCATNSRHPPVRIICTTSAPLSAVCYVIPLDARERFVLLLSCHTTCFVQELDVAFLDPCSCSMAAPVW